MWIYDYNTQKNGQAFDLTDYTYKELSFIKIDIIYYCYYNILYKLLIII